MIAPNARILWLPGEDSRNWDYESGGWASSNRNPSGVKVDAETALRSTTVLACMRVLSTSVAGLPLHVYRRLPGGGKELAREHPLYRLLHTTPNGWQTSVEWREQLMLHMLSYGQAFNEKVYAAGQISEIVPLHPSRMKTEQLENNRLRYAYREAQGTSTVYTQDAIMHVRGMSDDGVNGMSMIELARDAIGLARACEIHGATFFGNGARPGVILSTDQMLSPEAAENTRNQWERAHRGPDRSNRTAVLQGGLKVNELGGNNQESQFLEARRFQVEEVCRVFGVPPHLVGDLTRSSFSNIEQQSLDYLQNGLMPWLRRIESAIARDLLDGDDEYFAEFDTRGVLRADAAGRAAYYNTLWNLGVASVNEIRSWENMNPVDGGDTRFVQLNMTTLEKAAAEPEVPATVVEEIVVDETAPAPEPASEAPAVEAEEGPQIADVSLNGAQVSSLLEIVAQYNAGLLNEQGAKAIIAAAFPGIPASTVNAIIAGTNTSPVAMPGEATAPEPLAASLSASRDCGTGAGGFKPGNKCAPGGGGGNDSSDESPSGGGSLGSDGSGGTADVGQLAATAKEFGVDSSSVHVLTDSEMQSAHGDALGNFDKATGKISIRATLPDGYSHDDVLRHEAMHARFESFHKSGGMTRQVRDSLNAERYSPSKYSDAVWDKVREYELLPGGIHSGAGRAMFDHAVNESLAEMARAGGAFPETPPAWADLYGRVAGR